MQKDIMAHEHLYKYNNIDKPDSNVHDYLIQV